MLIMMKIFFKKTEEKEYLQPSFSYYNLYDIELFVVNNEFSNGRTFDNRRLNLLLYFIQAAWIEEKKKLCFQEEFRAWAYNPIMLETYSRYKGYGSFHITSRSFEEAAIMKAVNAISEYDQAFLSELLEESSQYSTQRLMQISRNQSPFQETMANYEKNKLPDSNSFGVQYANSASAKHNAELEVIPNALMFSYFSESR